MSGVELVVIVVVVAICSALIGGLIGDRGVNDRGPVGFVLGLLFGPIGWFVVTRLGPSGRVRREAEDARRMARTLASSDNRPRVPCPYCAQPIIDGAMVCRSCGQDLVAVPISALPGTHHLPCIFCHSLNEEGSTVCMTCGRDIFTH